MLNLQHLLQSRKTKSNAYAYSKCEHINVPATVRTAMNQHIYVRLQIMCFRSRAPYFPYHFCKQSSASKRAPISKVIPGRFGGFLLILRFYSSVLSFHYLKRKKKSQILMHKMQNKLNKILKTLPEKLNNCQIFKKFQ